jgi:hypothetical protein
MNNNNRKKTKGCFGAMCNLGRKMFTRRSAKVVPQNNEYMLETWLHMTTKKLFKLMSETPKDEFNPVIINLANLFRGGGYIQNIISPPNPLLLNRIISRVDQILADITTVRTMRKIQSGVQNSARIINSAMDENVLAPQYEGDDPTTKYTVDRIMAMTANLKNRDDPFGFSKENKNEENAIQREIAGAITEERLRKGPVLAGISPLELPRNRRGGSRKSNKRRTYKNRR